jgi:hypothetical protein
LVIAAVAVKARRGELFMGEGFIKIEHEAGDEGVGCELGQTESSLGSCLAAAQVLCGILRMGAVMGEGSLQLAL